MNVPYEPFICGFLHGNPRFHSPSRSFPQTPQEDVNALPLDGVFQVWQSYTSAPQCLSCETWAVAECMHFVRGTLSTCYTGDSCAPTMIDFPDYPPINMVRKPKIAIFGGVSKPGTPIQGLVSFCILPFLSKHQSKRRVPVFQTHPYVLFC